MSVDKFVGGEAFHELCFGTSSRKVTLVAFYSQPRKIPRHVDGRAFRGEQRRVGSRASNMKLSNLPAARSKLVESA